jgi:hypothetical protein
MTVTPSRTEHLSTSVEWGGETPEKRHAGLSPYRTMCKKDTCNAGDEGGGSDGGRRVKHQQDGGQRGEEVQ